MEKEVVVGAEGSPSQLERGTQAKPKNWVGGLRKRTPRQLGSDHSVLKYKPKAPATPALPTCHHLVSKCEGIYVFV